MDEFETLLNTCRNAVERYAYCKLPSVHDAEDMLQEAYIAAYSRLDTLRDRSMFKPWLLRILQNKCRDFYRTRLKRLEVPLDLPGRLAQSRRGIVESDDGESAVLETLDRLSERDRQTLTLYYFRELSQADIAARLGIPVGTVKSRLHTARQNFKASYPFANTLQGVDNMKALPEMMPEYTITKSELPPFPVVWEEMMGWFIVPKPGESLRWAMYDFPEKKRTEMFDMRVTGKASVHGIDGVEIVSNECNSNPAEHKNADTERRFVVQLTDTHCRILAESHMDGGVKRFFTFLDGDPFLDNWGFGEDNCGNETHVSPKGIITRDGANITCDKIPEVLDVVGRYTLDIGGRMFDTVCVIDLELYDQGVASEQYIDEHGRTVLWRRFNRDDWAYKRYGQLWTEKLPRNERIFINGQPYVHWYDCITDYIL